MRERSARPPRCTRACQASTSGARQRLGLERRIAGARGERAMQLRGARGERLDEREVGAVARVGRTALRLEEALEVLERVAPAVALVRHVGLQQRERQRVRSSCRQVLDRAGHRHAVRELRHLGEEAADLELGVHAGAQPPVALEEQALAERAPRCWCSAPAARPTVSVGDVVAGDARGRRSVGVKRSVPLRGRQAAALADRLDHVAAEAPRRRSRRPMHADVRLLAHARDGRARERAHVLLVLFPGERQRQEIARLSHLERASAAS